MFYSANAGDRKVLFKRMQMGQKGILFAKATGVGIYNNSEQKY